MRTIMDLFRFFAGYIGIALVIAGTVISAANPAISPVRFYIGLLLGFIGLIILVDWFSEN